MDVSQLLRLYQARGWGALPAEDLLLYLKRQDQGRYWPGGRGEGQTDRSRVWPMGGPSSGRRRGPSVVPKKHLLSFSGEESTSEQWAQGLLPPSVTGCSHLCLVSSFLLSSLHL